MNVYATESIRNVVLLGHGGCGKTSLIESMAFTTGIIKRVRTVTEGGTVSDYDKEEVKRKFSIQSSVIPLEVDGVKVNLLDTPGFFDFSGEVYEALSVADGAIIVINGKSGVEVGTRKSFEFCAKRGIPVIVYITCVEDEHVDASAIIDELRESYGNKIVPFHMPMKEGTEFKGFINAAKMLECRLQPNGTYYEKEVEEGVNEELDEYRQQLMEGVAETSEELMEKFFAEEPFTEEEIKKSMISLYPAAWNKIYHRRLFEQELRFQKGVWFEDVEFLYRLFPHLHSIGVVNQPFYQYVQRDGAITATFDHRLFDYLKNWETILASYHQNGQFEKYQAELQYSCMRYLYATFLKGVARGHDFSIFQDAYRQARTFVHQHFSRAWRNPYFYRTGAKGIYLLTFQRLSAWLLYLWIQRK